jgi:hypothetical protein
LIETPSFVNLSTFANDVQLQKWSHNAWRGETFDCSGKSGEVFYGLLEILLAQKYLVSIF